MFFHAGLVSSSSFPVQMTSFSTSSDCFRNCQQYSSAARGSTQISCVSATWLASFANTGPTSTSLSECHSFSPTWLPSSPTSGISSISSSLLFLTFTPVFSTTHAVSCREKVKLTRWASVWLPGTTRLWRNNPMLTHSSRLFVYWPTYLLSTRLVKISTSTRQFTSKT